MAISAYLCFASIAIIGVFFVDCQEGNR